MRCGSLHVHLSGQSSVNIIFNAHLLLFKKKKLVDMLGKLACCSVAYPLGERGSNLFSSVCTSETSFKGDAKQRSITGPANRI